MVGHVRIRAFFSERPFVDCADAFGIGFDTARSIHGLFYVLSLERQTVLFGTLLVGIFHFDAVA